MENLILTNLSIDNFQELIRKSVSEELGKFNIPTSDGADVELLKSKDVAKLLQISEQTLSTWKKQGKIPFHRIGSRVFFKRNEIENSLILIQKQEGRYARKSI